MKGARCTRITDAMAAVVAAYARPPIQVEGGTTLTVDWPKLGGDLARSVP